MISFRFYFKRRHLKTRKWRNIPLVCLLVAPLISAFVYASARGETGKTYVGSEVCRECHENEYTQFTKFAKKSHSFQSVKKMAKGLTQQEVEGCFQCHTTGYGKPGGFQSETETPHLKNTGCEVCHNAGSLHAETGDPEDIKGDLTAKDCEVCHNSERVADFNYKPLIYGGAH
ncbi:MAG TPA: cytochrome c family protein [Desulfatiglandales bacterium]|nr:cytochrome c family protein [Desulfatiglandales bacterium]